MVVSYLSFSHIISVNRLVHRTIHSTSTTTNPTHAQSSYQQPQQIDVKLKNPTETTVEYALSKGTAATECTTNGLQSQQNQPQQNITINTTTTNIHLDQSADLLKNISTMSSDLCKDVRDRLGLWNTTGDSEVAGNVSGLERLRNGRFNKVIILDFRFIIIFTIHRNEQRNGN